MLILILIVVLAVGAMNGYVLWALQNPDPHPDVQAAIRAALTECGLGAAYAVPEADLLRTGKFAEVIFHASTKLGKPLKTTQDLAYMLTRHMR